MPPKVILYVTSDTAFKKGHEWMISISNNYKYIEEGGECHRISVWQSNNGKSCLATYQGSRLQSQQLMSPTSR